VPEILIIDRHGIASAWTGKGDYTDGASMLCTPPEMDVGFPYLSDPWPATAGGRNTRLTSRPPHPLFNLGHDISLKLQERFSWQRYLLADKTLGAARLHDYILRGQPFPSHRRWGDYLTWVFNEAGATESVRIGEVEEAFLEHPSGGKLPTWIVKYKSAGNTVTEKADALVLTGSGDPVAVEHMSDDIPSRRVLDAGDFWKYVGYFRKMAVLGDPDAGDPMVAVIGAGGAAATILNWLIATFSHTLVPLYSVSGRGAFFPRGDGYGERQWLADPYSWTKLSSRKKRDILRQTDAGVISARLKDAIEGTDRIIFIPERVASIEWIGSASPGQEELRLRYEVDEKKPDDPSGKTHVPLEYLKVTHVIQATGFDPWSLLKVIRDPGGGTQNAIAPFIDKPKTSAARERRRRDREDMEENVNENLVLPLFPNLHVPALAGMRGLGFPSLGSLGLTAARVLDPYVKAVRPRRPRQPKA
jgi:mycobactin lysine-N-oxygenase